MTDKVVNQNISTTLFCTHLKSYYTHLLLNKIHILNKRLGKIVYYRKTIRSYQNVYRTRFGHDYFGIKNMCYCYIIPFIAP